MTDLAVDPFWGEEDDPEPDAYAPGDTVGNRHPRRLAVHRMEQWAAGTTPAQIEAGEARTVVGVLIEAVRAGLPPEVAARYAGANVDQMKAWLSRGSTEQARRNEGDAPDFTEERFVVFLESFEAAEAACEVRVVTQWQNQIPKDWRAADKFLSKRFPQRWGEGAQQTTTVTVNITPESAAAGIAELAARLKTRQRELAIDTTGDELKP